jgi:hypothetical protein
VLSLPCAGEQVQGRGACASWACGGWGVRWGAAEGKGRLDGGDHKVAAPLHFCCLNFDTFDRKFRSK